MYFHKITKITKLGLENACNSIYKIEVLMQLDLFSNTVKNVKKVKMYNMLSNTSYLFLS